MSQDGTVSMEDGFLRARHFDPNADIPVSVLVQDQLAPFSQKLTDFRTWDALAQNLPGTAASDDLALVTGTLGTDAPQVQSGDLKASAGTVTRYARMLVSVPKVYEAGETLQFRLVAGMKTTVSDTTATIDLECRRIDPADGSLSSDLVTTSATSINSLGPAARDFAVTASSIEPGDTLDVRVAIAINDGATGTAVIGVLAALILMCDCRP